MSAYFMSKSVFELHRCHARTLALARLSCMHVWALQTKKNALECLSRLLDSLDKMVILEEVLPFLTEIQCSDVDIIMAVVG